MNVNWEVILWTCITLAVIMGTIGMILGFISSKNMRKRREDMQEIHTGLRVGARVLFAGGFYGKVVGIHTEEETINVEIAKGTVVTISRYALQGIVK